MASQSIGNRIAVFLIVAIIAILAVMFLVRLRINNSSSVSGTVPLSEFGFKEYAKDGPFVINVDQDFPNKRKYMFVDQDGRVGLTNDDGEVIFHMDAAFSVAASFDPKTPGKVSEYSVTINGIDFMDLDVNGSFDYRTTLEPARRVDVWYDNAWCETIVPSGDKYEKQLVSGETVAFDKQTGKWSLKVQ